MNALTRKVESFLWNPPESLTGHATGRLAVRILRVAWALVMDITRGQLTLRAMSLVYTTLLSIVPLIAFSFSVLKAFGFHQRVQPLLYEFFAPLGPKGVELADRIIEFVDNVKGGVLGTVGLLLLIYTVISMIQKVEHSANWIWQVDKPRSLARKFSDYLSVILVGPVLMLAAMGMLASISSHALVRELTSIEPFGTAIVVAGKLMPIVLVTFVFAFIYEFVINTRVRLRAAAIGGFSAAVLWAVTSRVFASFVVGSTKYDAIYSSFAIVIVALIWLYLNWLILLLGAQIAFYVQHPDHLRPGRRGTVLTARQRLGLGLDVMLQIALAFRDGDTRPETNDLAAGYRIPGDAVGEVVSQLERAGLIAVTDEDRLLPGRDPDRISMSEVFAAIQDPPGEGLRGISYDGRVGNLMDALEQTLRERFGDLSLAEFAEAADAD